MHWLCTGCMCTERNMQPCTYVAGVGGGASCTHAYPVDQQQEPIMYTHAVVHSGTCNRIVQNMKIMSYKCDKPELGWAVVCMISVLLRLMVLEPVTISTFWPKCGIFNLWRFTPSHFPADKLCQAHVLIVHADNAIRRLVQDCITNLQCLRLFPRGSEVLRALVQKRNETSKPYTQAIMQRISFYTFIIRLILILLFILFCFKMYIYR